MRRFLTIVLLALGMLAAGSSAQAQVSFGIRIGPPPAPRVVHSQPHRPGADYVWIGGYWYPVGHKYVWHGGYWTRPPYEHATWIAPHHDGEQFFAGYWSGNNGRAEHDHRSDHQKDRDYHR